MCEAGDAGNVAQHMLIMVQTRYGQCSEPEDQLMVAQACGKLLMCLAEDGAVAFSELLRTLTVAAHCRAATGPCGDQTADLC